MIKKIVKAVLVGVGALYVTAGAVAAWLMNDGYDDIIDGYIAADMESGEDTAELKIKRRLVKLQIVVWTVICVPFKFIKHLFNAKKESN